MKLQKNKKLFIFILSILVFSFAIGNHDYKWLWRWYYNPVRETSLYHLSDNQPSKNKVFILFSHGLCTSLGAGTLYKIYNLLPQKSDFYGFRYTTDEQPFFFPFPSPKNTNFAQAPDMECIKKAYSDSYNFIRNNKYQITIVYGVSRGATAPFTVLANISDDENAKNFLEIVNAFVLESPFASMDDVVENMSEMTKKICFPLSWITKKTIGFSQNFVHDVINNIFKSYDKNGMSACEAINTIYEKNEAILDIFLDKPILLVCTKKDSAVPVYSTVKIYYMLKKIGHKKVDIYIADKGCHGLMALLNTDKYRKAVNYFYKKNNIPCDEKLAKEGLAILEEGKKKAKEILKNIPHPLAILPFS